MNFLTPWIRRLLFCALGWLALGVLAQDARGPAVSSALNGQKHIALPLAPTQMNISDRFAVASDPSASKTIADMTQADFKPLNGPFAVGYSTQAYWLRFTVSDPAERVREWWLELEPPFIDRVDFYEELANGQFRHAKAGDTLPASLREVANQSFVFQLSPRASPTRYYIRLQSSGPMFIKARLWHNTIFAGEAVRYAHWLAAAYGGLALLLLITLVQGVVLKQSVYLAFVAHISAVLLTLLTGVLPLYLPDNWYGLMDALPSIATCLSVTAYGIFCNYFVLDERRSRIYRRLFLLLASLGLLGALACINPAYRWVLQYILIAKIAGSLLPVAAVSRGLGRSSWYDRLVWLGIVAYVPAQAILYWRITNFLQAEGGWATIHSYIGVLLLHMLLLTFALAGRMQRMAANSQQLRNQLATERQLKDLADKTAFDQRSFLAMVAHELRGPLAVTRSAAYNLSQMVTPQTEAVLTRIERMDTGLQQMASLIAVCLTHEREGFAQPLSLNLHLTAAQLRLRLEPYLDPAVAARVRWPDEDADASSTHHPITGNPALLTIAVRNMLENAARFDASGARIDVAWEVNPGTQGKPDAWRISVLDRGPGIPAERMDHIFEPFVRGTHADNGGLGLGLYIIKRIASMHGATAAAQPRNGGGTVICIGQGYQPNRPLAQ